jgi:hypothetical protein
VVVLVGDGRHEPGVLVHVVLDDLQPAVGEPGPVVDFSCVHFSCFSAEFSAEIQEKKILRNKFSGNFQFSSTFVERISAEFSAGTFRGRKVTNRLLESKRALHMYTN